MSNVIFVKMRIIIGTSVLFEKEFFLKSLSLVLDSESSLVSKGYKSSNVLVASSSRSKTIYVLNSSFTFHMIPLKHWFSNLKEFDSGKVLLGNDNECLDKGINAFILSLIDETLRVREDVRFVLELKKKLIPLGTFDCTHFSIKIENRVMKVLTESLVSFRAKGL